LRTVFANVKRLKNVILVCAILAAVFAVKVNAESSAPPESTAPVKQAASAEQAAPAEHGIPRSAQPLGHEGGFITNSMLVTWIVAAGVIVFARFATRRIQAVPSGAQNFWEWLVEGLRGFLESIIGPQMVKRTFWFFATIFIFILAVNWFGLLPGVGTIGRGVETAHGFKVTTPLLRGGNADLNMTAAMALIFMVLWLIWSLQAAGVKGFFLHIFGPKGDSTGFIKYMMIVVFFAVGFLELISIAFRPVSLSFRLYGNIFAGENLLEALANTVQHPAWARAVFSALLPVPFYFLELLVGLVQAFVFMLLTTVFTALMCTHEEEPGKEEHH
jgi:F-type H+-transporting ATPase subunit a